MLSRLRAEEALDDLGRLQAANPKFAPAARSAYRESLKRQADGSEPERPQHPNVQQLARHGLHVVHEPVTAASSLTRFRPGERPGRPPQSAAPEEV